MKRLLALFFLFLLLLTPLSVSAAGETLVVSPNGPYFTLDEAISTAQDGDVIEVRGGVYPGPVLVNKSVVLEGVDWPVIDGGGEGTVIKLLAPDIVFRGFVIRNSGASLDQENSGMAAEAPGLLIENNKLEETLFGIYLREASNSVIRGNHIQSKDLEVPRRGDPIRVWYSNDVLIENNTISKGRDVVLWYSEHLTVRDNTVIEGRYGLHFMYCDDAIITGNYLADNSVGTFMMYSRRLQLLGNTIAFNHGPSGYGIGLKDMDDAVVQHNIFVGNRIGAHLDNSPREVDSIGLFDGNVFAYNDIGVNLMPSVRHNQFKTNSFIDNQEHVQIAGGGVPGANEWTIDGRGNFWSDYAGYDEDLDGLGDEPYKAERLFENLMDKNPNLRLLIYSPATQAVDFAAKAVPFVRPQPKLIDDVPLMAPTFPSDVRLPSIEGGTSLLWASLLMMGIAGSVFLAGRFIPQKSQARGSQLEIHHIGDHPMIHVSQLSKSYGKHLVLDNVNFDIQPGQAVALWGPNGAGKTTALRCLLGVIPWQGNIQVAELDMRYQGKKARQQIGFVPQELAFHDDMTVHETLEFYAKLKHTTPLNDDFLTSLLSQVGLETQFQKWVGELSGGMKQRLALAVALLGDPPLLLLDEPTSNLDARSRGKFLDLLLELKESGKTMVFSSHRLEEVSTLADRVLLLDNGKLIADCPPSELGHQTGWDVTLYILVAEGKLNHAVEALISHGYNASPNGRGLRVKVTPGQKGHPISTLAQAGIQVEDFEIEGAQ